MVGVDGSEIREEDDGNVYEEEEDNDYDAWDDDRLIDMQQDEKPNFSFRRKTIVKPSDESKKVHEMKCNIEYLLPAMYHMLGQKIRDRRASRGPTYVNSTDCRYLNELLGKATDAWKDYENERNQRFWSPIFDKEVDLPDEAIGLQKILSTAKEIQNEISEVLQTCRD